MTAIRIDGVEQQPVRPAGSGDLSVDRLRTIVQDSHLSFLIGAGTPSPFFTRLGNIEEALTALAASEAPDRTKAFVRASIQGYFFEKVLLPNRQVINRDPTAESVLLSYATFLRTINRILLKRRSSLLGKQVNMFTTNVDMVFEVALELMGIDFSDGFSGKIHPKFDLGEFNTLRFRQGPRFEHRSEMPVVNLFKIHGSAAWRQVEQSAGHTDIYFDHGLTLVGDVEKAFTKAKPELLVIASPDDVDAEKLIEAAGEKELSADGEAFASAYEKLGIVNPDKTKFATTVLNATYYELIRRFANELEKENSVLFVHGFSFRDEHLRDLVVRAARTNPTLLVVVFCYSRKGKADLEALIPDVDVKNGNVLYVVPAEPGDGDEEEGLSLEVLNSKYFAPIVADKIPQPDQRIELDIRTQSAESPNA